MGWRLLWIWGEDVGKGRLLLAARIQAMARLEICGGAGRSARVGLVVVRYTRRVALRLTCLVISGRGATSGWHLGFGFAVNKFGGGMKNREERKEDGEQPQGERGNQASDLKANVESGTLYSTNINKFIEKETARIEIAKV